MSHADITVQSHSPAGVVGSSPFKVTSKKMAMWLFIISDTMTFAACLLAYGFLRNAAPSWPTPFKFSPTVVNAMIMTFILVTSSLTMLLGVRAARLGDRAGAFRLTMITAALGIVFAVLHLREWFGMIDEGVTLFHNPWGNANFGAAFFSITGLHLLHVTGGIVALLVVGMRYNSGRLDAEDMETMGLYWHFVDLVWMFVVPLVYLLNVAR